jgi:hypothetical protein
MRPFLQPSGLPPFNRCDTLPLAHIVGGKRDLSCMVRMSIPAQNPARLGFDIICTE